MKGRVPFQNKEEVLPEHSKGSFARDMMGRESNVILIDEFDKFFTKTTSAGFINTLKGILNNCSEKHHLTFFLTTNNLQKIPYELINSHRIGLNVNLDPPNKEKVRSVLLYHTS